MPIKPRSTNAVAVYHNSLNTIPFSKMTEIERNLLIAVIAKMKERQGDIVEIPFEFFQSILNKTATYNRAQTAAVLDQLEAHFFDLKVDAIAHDPNGGEWKGKAHLFRVFQVHTKTGAIRVQVDPALQYLVNGVFGGNFTKFEVEEFFAINGRYAKDLYRLLKQYKSTGWAQWGMDEFRELMCIPESYRQRDIDRRVLAPAVKELQTEKELFLSTRIPFRNLQYTKIKSSKGRGGRVVGIKFTFDATVSEKLQSS